MLAAVFPIVRFREIYNRLLSMRIINRNYRIVFMKKMVYFPIIKPHELIIRESGEIIEVSNDFFPVRPKKVLSLNQLEKKYGIPFPKSINIIGDIALLNYLPDLKYSKIIGQAIMSNYGVRGVFLKKMETKDPYRIAQWEKIAGYGDTFTVHFENNHFFALDIAKVFFNPRLSGERLRVINQVKSFETVVDMFTGVGTFAVPIAKKCANTHAIDINPAAIEFAEINKILNNLPKDKLVLYNRDAMELASELRSIADRIIMNYPERSLDFLPSAISVLKQRGIIHLYLFARGKTKNKAIEKAKSNVIGTISDIIESIKFMWIAASREVAPRKYMVSMDLLITKK